MGKGHINENTNVYFRARKDASLYNERLSSREGASEMLGISPSTLADYELGITKFVPVDKVVLMADLYNRPELKTAYCRNECPIGKNFPVATSVSGIEGITLRLLREFDPQKVRDAERNLIEICSDGVISEDEKPNLRLIIKYLDELMMAISELKLASEKILRE